MHFPPLLVAHWVRSLFENSRKWQCHSLCHFRWEKPWGLSSVPSTRTTKQLHVISHIMALPDSLQRHHQLPVPPCVGAPALIHLAGWAVSEWAKDTGWLQCQKSSYSHLVLKNHSHMNSNSGSIFLLISLLSTQFTHLLVGFNSIFFWLSLDSDL